MLTPVVCFSCGTSLGDLAPIYHAVRRKRMMARYGQPDAPAAATQASADPSLTEGVMRDVLEALQLTGCCRTRLVTAVIFSEHY